MEKTDSNGPPRLPLAFFRWYCHPNFREEIEGDLLERFHYVKEQYGILEARRFFTREVILLFRPAIKFSPLLPSTGQRGKASSAID